MLTPSPDIEPERPTDASSMFRISKEGIESRQSVPGEHTTGLLSSAVLTICATMAVVAPAVTLKVATSNVSPMWIVVIILVQEAVILAIATIAWVRKRQ